jgi:Domain of unknown function (DUF4333)
MTSPWVRLALVLGAAATVVVGCTSGPPTVAKKDLSGEISEQLKQQVGRAPDSVTCPDDLKGEVGTKERCELKDGNDTYGVTVTVTSVKDSDVKFDIKVDEKPS